MGGVRHCHGIGHVQDDQLRDEKVPHHAQSAPDVLQTVRRPQLHQPQGVRAPRVYGAAHEEERHHDVASTGQEQTQKCQRRPGLK